MRKLLTVLATLAMLASSAVPLAAAHEGDPGHHTHRVGDGVDDTPLEIQQALDEAADEQHGAPGGHLPGSSSNVDLVGQVTVSGAVGADKPGHIADVASFGNFAYLAARRLNTNPCGPGGFYTIDISDPTAPTEVGFTAFPPDSYPGEGMQVIKLNTPKFKGDVLLTNNENCGTNSDRVGGMSIYNVTDPTAITPLAIGKGDTGTHPPRANQIHSVFGWQSGKRAFAIMVDNEEIADVDIMEITDPANPIAIAEVSILDWPGAQAPLANGESIFLHDLVVKRINSHDYALLSYWDAGWIVL
ncbi:MAG: hypothetical protein ABIZ34_03785, partial [Candidatus Limnocylindrales bacterium]